MVNDLVAFLRARLDEDEAAAWDKRYVWPTDFEVTLNPARVLREVEAKRAILALHIIKVKKADTYPFDPYTGEPNPDEYEVTCDICDWVSDSPTSACSTLRHLAAVYADHPDYDEAWKP